MPYEVAAMAEPVACCVHGIDRAGIRSGDVVLLLGAGTIGLVLLQLVRLQGAAVTIVSEPNAGKRDLAERLGATTAVDPVSEDFEQAVKAATGGTRPDVVIECVGSAATAQQAFDLVGEGGRVLLFGVAPEEVQITISPYRVYREEIAITGSFTNPFAQSRALALLASGRLRVNDLISHRLPLADVSRGIELLESGTATKVVIETQERG
jgi:threonine dehydrogenase-like Zn-dependent dehydrogenase